MGRQCAEQLFSSGEVALKDYPFHLRLKSLREINGRKFDYIEIIFTAKRRDPRRICFVGCRFVPKVTDTLLENLDQVLEPYNVELDYSGKDIRSRQIFDDIVKRIRRADFCIFDDRATQGHPNVYIEVGVAYSLKVPFILFEYARQGTSSVPSDLSHSLAIRYYTYQKLFPEFYASLPLFFKRSLKGR